MIGKLLTTAVLMLAAASAGAVGNHDVPDDRDAHDARVMSIRENHSTIALQPIRLPDVADASVVRADFHRLLQEKLESHGFEVVPADVFAEQWRAKLEDIGGVYDAVTGERDEARYDATLAAVRAGLAESHGASAFLVTGIDSREVAFSGGTLTYGGVKEKAYVKGGKSLFGTTLNVGILRAVFLEAELFDMQGTSLYANTAGVQLLNKMGRDGTVPVDPQDILRVEANNRAAVTLALRAMLLDHRALVRDIKTAKRNKARD